MKSRKQPRRKVNHTVRAESVEFMMDPLKLTYGSVRANPGGNLEALMVSMFASGQLEAIIISRDGKVISGERRAMAAIKLGWPQIRCVYIDNLSVYHEQQKAKYPKAYI